MTNHQGRGNDPRAPHKHDIAAASTALEGYAAQGNATDNTSYEAWRRGEVSPAAITVALDYRGLYGPEVDIACGVAEPAVDQWEQGLLYPAWDQLVALSRLTEFPIAFFLHDIAPTAPGFVCVRSGRGRGCHRIPPQPAGPRRYPRHVVAQCPDTQPYSHPA